MKLLFLRGDLCFTNWFVARLPMVVQGIFVMCLHTPRTWGVKCLVDGRPGNERWDSEPDALETTLGIFHTSDKVWPGLWSALTVKKPGLNSNGYLMMAGMYLSLGQ
jgi:hypothetical protein